MFEVDKFNAFLQTSWVAKDFIYHKEISSTNTYLRKLPTKRLCHGVVCLADNQTKGRGQYNRKWISEPFSNLTFTIAFKPGSADYIHLLALSCALSVLETVQDSLDVQAFLKWPNDILCKNKKISGMLAETVFKGNTLDRFLVGIGINVNQLEFPKPIAGQTTSLARLNSNKIICRESLLAKLLQRVEFYYYKWTKQRAELTQTINKYIIGYGSWVHLNHNGALLPETYKILGINEQGHLLALSESDEIKKITHEQIRIVPPGKEDIQPT